MYRVLGRASHIFIFILDLNTHKLNNLISANGGHSYDSYDDVSTGGEYRRIMKQDTTAISLSTVFLSFFAVVLLCRFLLQIHICARVGW